MKYETISQKETARRRTRAQQWTAAVFIMAILFYVTIAWLHFQEIRTLNQTLDHLDNFRQANLDLHEGFIKLTLAGNDEFLFSHDQGLALLDQALASFERQASHLQQSDDLTAEFNADLENFKQTMQMANSSPTDAQTQVALWIAFDQLENHIEVLDSQTLDRLHAEAEDLTNAFSLAIIMAALLFTGVGLGVYRADRGRAEAEQQRLRSEALYRGVVEDQSELICRFTPDFRLIFINRAYAQLFGKPVAELIGTNILDLIPNNNQAALVKDLLQSRSIDEPTAVSELNFVWLEGLIRWQQWTGRAFFDDDGQLREYQAVGRDITEMKAAQERLHFLHTLTLATSTATTADEALQASIQLICEVQGWEYAEVWLPDAAQGVLTVGAAHFSQGDEDGRLQTFWQTTQSFTFPFNKGIPGRAWSSQTPSWTIDVQTLTKAQFLRLDQAIAANIHGIVAVPIIADKTVLAIAIFMAQRPLPQDDDLLQLLSTALQQIAPIIRRQQSIDALATNEAALRKSEDRLQAIINSQTHYVVRINMEGYHTYWNNAYQAQFAKGDLTEEYALNYICDYHHVRTQQAVEACLAEPGKIVQVELDKPDRAGHIRTTLWEFICLTNAPGEPTEIQCMGIDITERKQTELALATSARRLEVLNKIDQSILTLDTREAFAAQALDGVLSLLPARRASLFTFDMAQRTGKLVTVRMQEKNELDPELPAIVSMDYPNVIDLEIFATLQSQKFHLIQDLNNYPAEAQENLQQKGIQSVLSIGLKHQGELIGGLFIHASEKDFFTHEYVQIAIEIADQMAVGIHNLNQSTQIRQYVEEQELLVKQRTKELELEKTQTDAILQSSSDGILLLDETLHIRKANTTSYDLFACDQLTCIGSPFLRRFHPDDRAGLQQQLAQTLADHVTRRHEVRAVRQDGEIIYTEIGIARLAQLNDEAPRLVCTLRNITERKQAEDALRQSELRYRSLFEQSTDGVFILDLAGNHLLVNQHAAEMMGRTSEEMSGLSFRDVIHPDEVGQGETILAQLLAGERVVVYERRVKHKDGYFFPVELNVELVRDDQGQPLHIQSLMRDITERKQAEMALRQSEEKYRSLIESMHSGFVMFDTDDRFTYVNDHLCNILGFSREELIGKRGIGFVHPTDHRKVTTQYELRKQQESGTYELAIHHKEGHVVNVLVSASPILSVDGAYKGRVAVVTDITARKEAQQQLQQLTQRLQMATEAGKIGIWEWVVDSGELIWDQQMHEMFGIGVETFTGSVDDLATIVHPADLEQVLGASFAFVEGKVQDIPDFSITTPDGNVRHIRVRAQVVYNAENEPKRMIGTAVDMTQIREAAQELETLSQRLSLATEAGGIGVWESNYTNGHIVWNEQMYALYGLQPEDTPGSLEELWLEKVMHPDDVARVRQEYTQLLSAGSLGDYSYRVIMPDKSIRHIRARTAVFRDENGQPLRAVGVNWDVTDEKAAAESLQRALVKERELGELKSRFVSMASHEFRTPLATISATTETLLIYRDRLDENKLDQRLHKILNQVAHMESIMNDVLQLARIQAGRVEFKPEVGDLYLLCQEVVESFAARPDYEDRIQLQFSHSSMPYAFDKRLMRQIISNLISNALKYSAREKAIRVNLCAEETTITLTVKDEGIGIPQADLKRLFEPFHRATNVGTISGTGLGMSITREAVELHGGTIAVESAVNAGTIFTVELPRSESGQSRRRLD